jgi:hypothetical protein
VTEKVELFNQVGPSQTIVLDLNIRINVMAKDVEGLNERIEDLNAYIWQFEDSLLTPDSFDLTSKTPTHWQDLRRITRERAVTSSANLWKVGTK